MKLIIFDFDGTLVDSRPLILESHRIVFSEFGLPVPSPAHSLSLVGKSLDVILAELAGPAAPIPDMVRAYDLLLPTLRADPAFAERPFDGVDDLLHELSRTTDIVMAIATGHRSDTIAPALQTLRWADFFRTIQAADTAPSKPHPAMLLQALAATGMQAKDAIFIGDTTFDMQMAEAAQLRSIGVGWGHHGAERLTAAGARQVTRTVDDLRTAIRDTLSG
ncbi:HAD family hydrolase [Bradyrhizobium sp.]|uniref:HAD family hydrolase n=1 Tax=Bradyrhizobium sp. TaxID=376 RepID=UPI002BF43315|nr:HAD-IA family hydrolase [Bradyrhizobium sp.]HMM89141.1 HAD-IA family hydrolase [Bradyrhizobium sp.]